MQTATAIPSAASLAHWEKFPPLQSVTRTHVDTATAAHYLNRRPQTLRGWHCHGAYPQGLRPLSLNGRLAWPVAEIKRLLGA
jgi:hypothetical protein